MENLDLVYQTSNNSKSPTHPRPAECGSRQAIQIGPDHSNGVVPPTRGFSSDMQQVAPASNRPICHEVQQQVTSVRVTGTGSPGHSSRCTQPAMRGSGRICLPTSSHFGQSGGEVTGLPMQENHCDCSRVAQHALVLGPGDNVQQNPPEPSQPAKPVNTALQSDPSQKSDKSKSPCVAPRASAIKEQGFSEAVAARIEAPQRGSTRSVYEAKWAIFTKWCLSNQVDFRAPPAKNQLAKEGPDNVVIPALAPTLDKSLKSDRFLCPVRALRYYLDRTSGRIRSWFLSPSRKVSTKTPHLLPSPHLLNRP